MPFPESISPSLKAMYGVIERSVYERASTAEIWQAIRQNLPAGASLGRNAAAQVSTLRGYAAANRNASEHLAKLGDNEGITGRAVHTPIWVPASRDANARAAAPKIAARVQLMVHSTDLLDSGETELIPKWVTLHFDQLPATAGQLRDSITQAVTTGQAANGSRFGPYPYDVGSIGRIELLSL